MAWCAFLDPTKRLRSRRAGKRRLSREAPFFVHLAIFSLDCGVWRCPAFSVIVVDVAGVLRTFEGFTHRSIQSWPKVTRRLALAVENAHHAVSFDRSTMPARTRFPHRCASSSKRKPESLFVRIAKESSDA
jgi:hypothetical protein